MKLMMAEAAKVLDGILIGDDQPIMAIGTDSRNLVPGTLFFALRGARDGHAFVDAALQAGAVGAVVERSAVDSYSMPPHGILVEDTHEALLTLARWWRQQFDLPIIAVTGSNGKTTVKEMIASILKVACPGHTYSTPGNFNNEIGVPLSLFGLESHHRYAVIEIGMNHPGEVSQLAEIVRPQVALINNAQREHMAHFDSLIDVARANAEVFEWTAQEGIAVLNADDVFCDFWSDFNRHRQIIRFGLDHKADFSATYEMEDQGIRVALTTPQGSRTFLLPVKGHHNVLNALAAAACCGAVGIEIEYIATGLSAFQAVKGRLQFKKAESGATVIDDTYNANPDSVLVAISVLESQRGKKILVLGDMGEVGPQGLSFHREIGRAATTAGIDQLLTVGDLSIEATHYFAGNAAHFENKEALIKAIIPHLSSDQTILVKGSRFMKMEEVVSALLSHKE